jgi:hypothetical protein
VLCPTGHPGSVVAAALRDLREVADEIVIAADRGASAEDLGHYATVADTLLRYDYIGSNRQWAWLAAQARGDWLLILDGDELPSAALVGALRELVAVRHVSQYELPIRWVWPSPGAVLAAEPWSSDRRLRLMRNDGLSYFEGHKHVIARGNFPQRYVEELPVYHLDLALPDRARREAKVERYEADSFGLLTPEGLPFYRTFYLPETLDETPPTVPVPAEDRRRIERALAGDAPPPAPVDPGDVALHDAAAVAWHWSRRPLPEDAYRGEVALARPLPPLSAAGHDHVAWLRVTNLGTARWPGGADREPRIRVALGWRDHETGGSFDLGRAMLPHALGPGETTHVAAAIAAPPIPGPAELVVVLVHEGVRSFGRELAMGVEVAPSVEERLTALARDHGGLVPVAAAFSVRVAAGRRDALVNDLAFGALEGAAPADAEVAALLARAGVTGAVDAAALDRLAELLRAERPRVVVEFGAGARTVVLAGLLAGLDVPDPCLLSFDQDPAAGAQLRAPLAACGLEDVVVSSHLPLEETAAGRPRSYELTDEAAQLLRRHPPDLVLVGGPVLDGETSRLGVLDLVLPFVRGRATLLLADALGDTELCVAEAWAARPEVGVHGLRPTRTGLLEAVLTPR